MNLQNELRKHIKVVVHPLKEGLELELALKAKLTKKELKLLKAWAKDEQQSEIKKNLKLTSQDYEILSSKLTKKLNQEKVKQALYNL